MKKILFFGFVILPFITAAQTAGSEGSFLPDNEFNRWSVEFNVGMNKPTEPFTPNYFSSNPKKFFNISTVNHFDIGIRYMLSNSFGIKFDYGHDKISNQDGSFSRDFKSIQHRVGLQGVANLGSIMNFRSFTNRFNLLSHAGVQISEFIPKVGKYKGFAEGGVGVMFGFTPQLRITDKIVLSGDFTIINNFRQNYNWDGTSLSKNNNLSGVMYVSSVGLTYYIGKKKKHADWFIIGNPNQNETKDVDARNRIAKLEKMLNNGDGVGDGDGVADDIDSQSNTPNGVVVNIKGRVINVDKIGTADEPEKVVMNDSINPSLNKSTDAMLFLIENNYVNVFYDVNQDSPNIGSTNTVYQLIEFMKTNTSVKIKLKGSADLNGEESGNKYLSFRRADNLMKVLLDSGVDQGRIYLEAIGVDKNFNGKNENLNYARRVSIVLVK